MNFNKWLEDNSSEITLFGTKGVSVVRTEDIKEYMDGIVEELKQSLGVESYTSKSTCEAFKLEDGMFAKTNGKLSLQDLSEIKESAIDCEGYILYHDNTTCLDWDNLVLSQGIVVLGATDQAYKTQVEIPFEQFMQAVREA